MAALAGSDCFPLSGLPQLGLLPFHSECGLADASCRATRHGLWRWDGLTRVATAGRLEMTYNAAEGAIQPRALGRKNELFAASDTGGERAAMIYAFSETANLWHRVSLGLFDSRLSGASSSGPAARRARAANVS